MLIHNIILSSLTLHMYKQFIISNIGIGYTCAGAGHQDRMHPYRHYSSSSHDRPVVYSDGCCYGNGRQSASAGVGVYWGEK